MPVIRKMSQAASSQSTTSKGMERFKSRLKPIEFDQGIKILIYGRSGSGKTTLWATFPGKILAVVVSGAKNPGELRSINTKEYKKRVTQYVLESTDDVREMVELFPELVQEYETIVLDHVTAFQDLVLKEVLNIDTLPTQKGWGLASQQQYGTCTLRCKDLLRDIISFSGNVVIVAQEREFNTENEMTGELITPYVGAALSPSLTGWLNTAVDYICHTYTRQQEEVKEVSVGGKQIQKKVKTGETEYCLRTAPDPIYTTKFRAPKGIIIPKCIVDPSFSKIMSIINSVSE